MRNILLTGFFMFCLSAVLVSCDDYTEKRRNMVELQIKSRGITDPATLEAMMSVPRHLFVPEDLLDEAYDDYPLPIGYGQTISQPYVVALMTSLLHVEGNETALEIGTGSGYQAAVLATIVKEVYTVEIIPELAERADTTLKYCGYDNVFVRNADGYFGWEEHQPYDIIMITAAVDHIPPPLLQQLADGGRLVLPLGNPLYYQTLTVVEKQGTELITTHSTSVQFVPLTGYALGKESTPQTTDSREPEEKRDHPSSLNFTLMAGIILILIVVVILLAITWKMRASKK